MSFGYFYSSDSSDGEGVRDTKTLDLSYLMLDSNSLSDHLRNCIKEMYLHNSFLSSKNSEKPSTLVKKSSTVEPKPANETEKQNENASTDDQELKGAVSMLQSHEAVLGERSHSADKGLKYDNVTEKLYLAQNQIMMIPYEVVLFNHLRVLDLSNNSIEVVNDFILHIPTLQTLYLKNNQLTNESLPKDLSALTSIREINLSGNHMTVIPPQLFELSNLRYLYLGNNLITEVRPEIKALQK